MKNKEEKNEASVSSQSPKVVQSPQLSSIPAIETPKPQIATTPKSEPPQNVEPTSASRSSLASEELVDLHRKLIEKEKAVVDLEEKLATLKQKRAEDKNKLKEFEKLKMQNQQVCWSMCVNSFSK